MKRPAAFGIGYGLWVRARIPLVASLTAAAALAVIVRILQPGEASRLVAAAGVVPIAFAAATLVGVFTLTGDLSLPESGFPRHMMVLPVSNRALALTPMLYGIGCMAGLWVAVARLVFVPAGWEVPVVWPALMLAATVAWLQAASWSPFWFPYVRVGATLASLFGITGFTLVAQAMRVNNGVIVGTLTALIVLAVVLGVVGVTRARRGDGTMPPWGHLAAGPALAAQPRRPFASGERAQIWFELRRNCTMLPWLMLPVPVLVLLPPLFGATTVSFGTLDLSPSLVALTLCLGMSPTLAGVVGGSLGKPDAWGKESGSAFLATRPMTDNRLIAAKMKASAIALVLTWGVLLFIVFGFCLVPRRYSPTESVAQFFFRKATPRHVWVALLLVVGLVFVSWKNIVGSFALPLFGRNWLTNLAPVVMMTITASVLIGGYQAWTHPSYRAALLSAAQWLGWALLAAKLVVAAHLIRAIRRSRVADARQLVQWTLVWAVATVSLVAVVGYFLQARGLVQLSVGLILIVPYNRMIAMPLAWHHNRHR